MFTTLGCLVESFKNYKVRIQACSALCGVAGRQEYGTEYLGVWRALLRGLDNAQNIVDYQEIRHRDELINQVSDQKQRNTHTHTQGWWWSCFQPTRSVVFVIFIINIKEMYEGL